MLLTIDFESSIPIYLQIRSSIVEGIATGILKSGDPLPSVRNLALELRINMHTVNKAYTQLKAEGYVMIHRQRGVIVCTDGLKDGNTLYIESLSSVLRPIISEAVSRGLTFEEFNEIVKNHFSNIEKMKAD
jgi:GntR family transcriptional regulator